MFIGRKEELKFLNKCINSDRFEMIPIYGRRRVGKTELVVEFTKKYKTIFFTAEQSSEINNLNNLNKEINQLSINDYMNVNFDNFTDALEYIALIAENLEEPLVFVIDEYPYLAKSVEGISSTLQRIIDHRYLKCHNLLLILTGSSMSFMEHQVLGYQSPLYGRRTGQIKLLPMDYWQSKQFLPDFDIYEFMTIYGLTGGIPLYLKYIDKTIDLKENILENILNKNAYLYDEPEKLLMMSLRVLNNYNDILGALTNGYKTLNELSNKTKLGNSIIINCIDNLSEMGIITKSEPISSIGKRKPTYEVTDGLFSFIYRYQSQFSTQIETNKISLIYENIDNDLPKYTSSIFEKFCKEYLIKQNGIDNPFIITEIGSWWGKNPTIHNKDASEEEVDIVGLGFEKENIIIGECKWRNKITDIDVGEKLIERAAFFPYNNKHLYIFSKSDFSEKLKEYAKVNNIKLVLYKDMIK